MDDPVSEPVYHFVAFQEPHDKNQENIETELSLARSHAARISHLRRKKAKQAEPKPEIRWVAKNVVVSTTKTTTPKNSPSGRSQLKIKPSPWSLLSQEKSDPFNSYQFEKLPRYLRQCLEYAYDSVHPALIFATTKSQRTAVTYSWRRLGLEWPLMYHLQVAGAANIIRAETKVESLPTHVEILRLKHQNLGLSLVMKELHSLNALPSDGLLMAMVMAGMLTDPTSSQIPEIFRASPLARASNMHIYGRLGIIPATMYVLVDMVNQRGGIHTIKQYGMSSVLQIADLQFATRVGVAPSFPWVHESPSFAPSCALQSFDGETIRPAVGPGSGFEIETLPLDAELKSILKSAAEITTTLERYRNGGLEAPKLSDITQAADETHHRLMSIDTTKFSTVSRFDVLQNICRLAALIYNDMVLFPLPASTEIKPRLAGSLRDALDKFEVVSASEELPLMQRTSSSENLDKLILWALMLGGLASTFSSDRSWYTRRLADHISRLPSPISWTTFSEIMATFLWWDYVFDEPGARFWWEAQLLQSAHDTDPSSGGLDLFSDMSTSEGLSPSTFPSSSFSPSFS